MSLKLLLKYVSVCSLINFVTSFEKRCRCYFLDLYVKILQSLCFYFFASLVSWWFSMMTHSFGNVFIFNMTKLQCDITSIWQIFNTPKFSWQPSNVPPWVPCWICSWHMWQMWHKQYKTFLQRLDHT